LNTALAEQSKKREALNAATTKQEGVSSLLTAAKQEKETLEQRLAALQKWQ
jgi:hypothetical protein